MPDAIGIDLRAHALHNHIYKIILEVLGDARHKGCAYRSHQEQAGPAYELRLSVVMVAGGVSVDHMSKDDRIEEGEDLVRRSKYQRDQHQQQRRGERDYFKEDLLSAPFLTPGSSSPPPGDAA